MKLACSQKTAVKFAQLNQVWFEAQLSNIYEVETVADILNQGLMELVDKLIDDMTNKIDLNGLRRKLHTQAGNNTPFARLWHTIKIQGREAPEQNPWFLPFIALVEEKEQDILNAKQAIEGYLAEAETKGSRGHLFNIWCFAFPHCRWALWFDFMRKAGFYTDEESDDLAAKFLLIQFRDHHCGLRIKPDPECVDNQTAALALSSYIIGSIFAGNGPGEGNLARMLRDEAAPRLENLIGGMPVSGYSGEGSTYHGLIVSTVIPFLLEAIEELKGEELISAPLAPNGTSAEQILKLTRRSWMPGGLMLPWDDYGYQFGISFPLAYLAHRTGDRQSLALLENVVNYGWQNSFPSGWGFDTPVWTLIYWPDDVCENENTWQPWAEDTLGGVLVDPRGENYLMQMWDFTEPMCHRTHVNPNSLILARKGIPFSADGDVKRGDNVLSYEGAVFKRNFGAGASQELNLFKGCGGSHNCILVDGHEGLRPLARMTTSNLADFDPAGQSLTGDVTDLYKEIYPDCKTVLRRSRLVENRFWLVEDLADFAEEHSFTSRWWFRPEAKSMGTGVDVQTPEGALLQLRPVLGGDMPEVNRIDGFPLEPDGCSDRVDFSMKAKQCRWLYVLWPTDTVEAVQDLTHGWAAHPVEAPEHTCEIHPGQIPWSREGVPVASSWEYQCELDLSGIDDAILQIPRGVDSSSKLWLNGAKVELTTDSDMKLTPQMIECKDYMGSTSKLDIRLGLNFATGEGGKHCDFSFPDEPLKLCRRILEPELMTNCAFENGIVNLETSAGRKIRIAHKLMEV